jgi:ribosomal protein S18 acetylase RimI-like enzyme
MLFSRAQRTDFPELIALYRAATKRMDEQGIPQWDEIYPGGRVIREDISRGQMEVCRIDGRIAAAFSLEFFREGGYEPAAWRYAEPRFAVLHRLCVHPDFQGRGVAASAMDYLEERVRSLGVRAVRLDAFSQNPAALRLYEGRGYQKAGEIAYRKGLFYLYEKKL